MAVALRLENGRTVCERCVLADTALARMRGLLGRRELPRGEGLLLRPASSVHTGFMRFPIDVVFLDRANRVLKIAETIRPWRLTGARHAKTVIELAAGESKRRGLRVGDRIAVSDETVNEPGRLGVARRSRWGALPWKRAGADFLLGMLLISFALANLQQWRTTHRPVGLGIMALELMIAALFFIRRRPWVTSRSPLAWACTTIGAFGMLASRPTHEPIFHLDGLCFALQIAGAAGAAYTLTALGRSFGFVAANRGIRTSGPYAIVRHPLYVFYLVTDLGYVLENPSVRNALLLIVVTSFQLVRIRTEEDCLRSDPQYRQYCDRVRYRLVPHFW